MFSIIFLVVGVGVIAYSVFDWIRINRIIKEGNKTTAIITDIQEIGGDGGGSWVPIVKYKIDETEYTKKLRYASEKNKYMQKNLAIYFDSKKPSNFVVENEKTSGHKVSIIIGIVLIILFISLNIPIF